MLYVKASKCYGSEKSKKEKKRLTQFLQSILLKPDKVGAKKCGKSTLNTVLFMNVCNEHVNSLLQKYILIFDFFFVLL